MSDVIEVRGEKSLIKKQLGVLNIVKACSKIKFEIIFVYGSFVIFL